MPANFARLLWANYTSSWSKSLSIDKIDSHTVVSLTILGRTDRGRDRSRIERKVKKRERRRKREEKQEGEGRGPFISSRCVHAYMH